MKNDHYYTKDPTSCSNPVLVHVICRGHDLILTADAGVFSKDGLDTGTRILLESLPEAKTGNVLDLGCGWGPIGICLALENPECCVTFSDVNTRALDLTRKNAASLGISARFILSDGFSCLDGVFDMIVTNPPIRAGKKVIYQMFSDSADHLAPDGKLYLVIRKQQGAESAIRHLNTVYSNVDVIEKSGGFWVIRCSKQPCEIF